MLAQTLRKMFYGSRNALWVARLITDNVQCFLEAGQLIIRHFKLEENSAPQKKIQSFSFLRGQKIIIDFYQLKNC